MPRNITVTFEDGSNHVYQNAPDNITPDEVQARAQQEFGKTITALDGGRAAAPQEVVEQEEPGFMSRVGQDLTKRADNITQMMGRNTADGFIQGVANIPQMGMLAAGQVAGGASDIIGEGIQGTYKTVVPEPAQKAISGGVSALMNTPAGKTVAKGAQAVGETYQNFKTSYPDAAMALEGVANIAGLGYGEKAAGKLTKGIIKQPAPEAVKAHLSKQYSTMVKNEINKAIRPGVEGKRTYNQAQNFYNKAEDAVSTIVQNKNALSLVDEFGDVKPGALPKNLPQFSQAINQTKSNIYNQYNKIAEQAGKTGAMVDLQPVAKELDSIITNTSLIDNAPEIVEYAKKRAETYLKRGAYTTKEAQDSITHLNSSLDNFYKNPSYEAGSRAYVDSVIANNLRKKLDGIIEETVGGDYQGLKNQYGALKAIEKDVNRRAIVDARKSGKGLIDFSDVFSGERAAAGILTLNPVLVGEAAAIKGISALIKRINDPNRHVKSLFQNAEKIQNKLGNVPLNTMQN
jgi:hypothetical protein